MFEAEKRMRCLEAAVSLVNGLLASGASPSGDTLSAVRKTADDFLKFVNPVNSGDGGLPNQEPRA